MPVNLELSAVATELEKVSFHFNSKEGQWQRRFKLLHNCTHFTCQQSNAQNSLSQASIVREPTTSRCSSWIQKKQRNQRSNCQYLLDHRKSKRISEKHLLLHDYTKALECVTTNWIILQVMGIPDHLTCLLRNLYTGQGATVTTLHSFLLLSNIPLYKYHMGLKFFNNPYSLVIQYLLNKDVLGFFIKENQEHC